LTGGGELWDSPHCYGSCLHTFLQVTFCNDISKVYTATQMQEGERGSTLQPWKMSLVGSVQSTIVTVDESEGPKFQTSPRDLDRVSQDLMSPSCCSFFSFCFYFLSD